MLSQSHDAIVTSQFGPQADAYLTSAVHAQGEDLAALGLLIADRTDAVALDLGCGGGHVSYALAPRVASVTACDLSDAMVALVNTEARRRGLANVGAVQASAERLPLADASFDLVASRYSAHHWHDITAGLGEARRVLKPGGLAIFMDVIAPEAPLLDSWLQSLELLRDPSHVRDYSIDQWQTMLRSAGFRPEKVERFRLRLKFSAWVARINTPVDLIQAIRALQQRAGSEVVRHFALEADGSFTIDTMLMTASAV